MTRPAADVAELMLVALWLGAAAIVALVVAPAAFAVLPSRSLAGALVGRVLPVVFYAGMLLGLALIVIERLAGNRVGGRSIAGAVTLLACAIAQLVVGAKIAAVRAAIPGAIEALSPDDPRRVAFGRLHGFSVAWLGVAIVAALVAGVLAARAAAAGGRAPSL